MPSTIRSFKQILVLKREVPVGTSLNVLPLLLNEKEKLLLDLLTEKYCRPRRRHKGPVDVLAWTYVGTAIYDPQTQMLLIPFPNRIIEMPLPPDWSVKIQGMF
jgi:hypothetical protein